jgi:hypothetical protein
MPYSSYDKPFVARRDFDFIPRRSEVIVAPAENRDFEPLAAMANAKVPDVCATGELLREAAARDRDSILSFRLKGVLLGGVAFVFLNQIGVEGLLLDSIDLARPTAAIMANPIDDVAGIYIWATALDGRGILGLGNVAEHLSKRRFRFADLYGRPNTEASRFVPTKSLDLQAGMETCSPHVSWEFSDGLCSCLMATRFRSALRAIQMT